MLIAAIGASEVRAGVMYGAAGSTFVKIDILTGVATVIDADVGLAITALAWDANARIMYGTGALGGDVPFFTIDPDTGAISIINTNIGPNVVSLDFDDASQTLYAATFFSSVPRRLGTIDLGTGVFTGINNDVGHDIDSISFGPGGVLYAIGPSSGADDFFTINPVTGVASAPIVTDIGPNNISIDYSNQFGSLYGAFFASGGTVSAWRSVDETTGTVSAIINPNIGSHPLAALTVPELSSTLMVGLGVVLLVGAKRVFRSRATGC